VHGHTKADPRLGVVILIVIGEPMIEFRDELSHDRQHVDLGRKHCDFAITRHAAFPKSATDTRFFGGFIQHPVKVTLEHDLPTGDARTEPVYVHADYKALDE